MGSSTLAASEVRQGRPRVGGSLAACECSRTWRGHHLRGLAEVRLRERTVAATNAYVVLAHSVLEEYLEDAFEAHFVRLLGWLESPMVPIEVARLALAVPDWLPDARRVGYKQRSLSGYLRSTVEAFRGEVRGNNGIKAANVLGLAKLVGVDWREFESSLSTQLADLNTLGTKRGEAGHLSPYTDKAVQLTRQDYPENVREWVHTARDAAVAIKEYLDGVVACQQPLSLIVDWDGN